MKKIASVIAAVFALVLGLAVALPAQAGSAQKVTISGKLIGPQQSAYKYRVHLEGDISYTAPVQKNGMYEVSVAANDRYWVSFTAVRKSEEHWIEYTGTPKNPYPDTAAIEVEEDDLPLDDQYFVALKGKLLSGEKGIWMQGLLSKSGTKKVGHIGAWALTGKGGKYNMPLVVSGSKGDKYLVESNGSTKWVGGRSSVKTAKPKGAAVTLDVKVKRTGTISGKLTLPKNTTEQDREVQVWKGKRVVAHGVASAKSGKYTVKGLAAGSYKVTFARASLFGTGGAEYTVPGRIYKGKKESSGFGKAKTVKVKSGKTKKNINDKLVRTDGGTVTVKVKGASKKKPYIVYLYSKNKQLSTRSVEVTSSKAFKIKGVSPGKYDVYLRSWKNWDGKKKGTVKVAANKTTKISKKLKY